MQWGGATRSLCFAENTESSDTLRAIRGVSDKEEQGGWKPVDMQLR